MVGLGQFLDLIEVSSRLVTKKLRPWMLETNVLYMSRYPEGYSTSFSQRTICTLQQFVVSCSQSRETSSGETVETGTSATKHVLREAKRGAEYVHTCPSRRRFSVSQSYCCCCCCYRRIISSLLRRRQLSIQQAHQGQTSRSHGAEPSIFFFQ